MTLWDFLNSLDMILCYTLGRSEFKINLYWYIENDKYTLQIKHLKTFILYETVKNTYIQSTFYKIYTYD